MAYGLTQSADLESGSSQYFSRADTASLSITSSITLEGWIKIESLSSQQFLCTKQDGGSNRSWQFQIAQSGANYFLTGYVSEDNDADITSEATGTTNMSAYTGQWVHVAFAWNPADSGPRIYINGVEESYSVRTDAASSMYDGGSTIRLGAIQSTPMLFFDGRMNLWRIWSTARSQSDISANLCNVLGSTTNLAAEWTLNNTLNDNSGNSNTLTNNNSITFGSDVPAFCVPSGPITIKTLNGVTSSTIKTRNGIAWADIKTINGQT